ncbi:MAG: phosphoribosylformylglycinamidine synthase subunit PurL [Candidatus Cryosericum sp.]|nr:phosphoribosylformylglycinamidine synthase subunit PurL [bacterium]
MNPVRAERVGLTATEYRRVCELLGREPGDVELDLFGVMWSEHCSYKTSRPLLRLFPTSGPGVLQGPGENAGIVDIGDDLAVVMKVESHNHPSAVEPYQGAATGSGGIIRDIFTMGARPVAMLDSLRFGDLEDVHQRALFREVVKGIGDYDNCMGIPTVAGEVGFDPSYAGNCLVNAMCVGIIRHEDIKRGAAAGVGNAVMLVGSTTGRDGMGGASFASVDLTAASQERKSAVQVGDPFMEKLLLEACLELFRTDAVVGIQDLGAAGLTSASCETAARGGVGIDLDVELVPRREDGMSAVEVMISESQERMLVIVRQGHEDEVRRIFDKWGLNAAVIGHVTEDGMLTVRQDGEVVAQVPAKALAEQAPLRHPQAERPTWQDDVMRLDETELPAVSDWKVVLKDVLRMPTVASKEWVYRQYDSVVRTSTVVGPGSDAAVLRVDGTTCGIALTIDGAGPMSLLDPATGAAMAVAEAARNLVCSGARPLALTDCLNFGNPERPDVFWQFSQAVAGMSKACRALGIPVIGGNVSFYNETGTLAILPTPVVGMVGVMDDPGRACRQGFVAPGDSIVLLGECTDELGGSVYVHMVTGRTAGHVPVLDLERECLVQTVCQGAVSRGIIRSAHDVSEGGLAVTLAESCITGDIGAHISLPGGVRPDALLFGEAPSRIVVSVAPEDLCALLEMARNAGVPATLLGCVGGSDVILEVGGRSIVQAPVTELADAWRGALPGVMGR